jgi:hypothetical protein
MVHVKEMHSLRFLHLIDVPITDDGLAQLEGMTHLESLYVDGAELSDQSLQHLFEALPNLHVHLDQQHHDRDPHKHAH